MPIFKTTASLIFLCVLLTCGRAQDTFTNCTAAFLNNQMVVNAYTPEGKCVLPLTSTGTLTVCTVNLSPEAGMAVDKIKFSLAIRDHKTGTLMMYSPKSFTEIDIRQVLDRCQSGDHVVLLTHNNEFSLPHNEIEIQ